MRNRLLLLFIFIIICFGFLYSQARGVGKNSEKVNSSYKVSWNLIASGGCVAASSGSHTISASVGQVVVDSVSSVNHIIYAGFFNPSIVSTVTSVNFKIKKQLPKDYHLDQNYPNPFNPITAIDYALPEASEVLIEIYDIMGRCVIELRHENLEVGYYSAIWDGLDHFGRNVSSGVYCYRIIAKSLKSDREFIRARKMLFVK